MKIKTLLITLSVIGFLLFLLVSCSQEEDMDIGGTDGNGPRGAIKPTYVSPIDSIAIPDLPKD